jgi:hypothetical protein
MSTPLNSKKVGMPKSILPDVVGDDFPDLMHMPGATVLRGDEREKSGAAAHRPHH